MAGIDEGLVIVRLGRMRARRYESMAAIFSTAMETGRAPWTSILPISAIWLFSSKQ